MSKYNYIIYHKKCIDGFSGFFVFLKTKQWDPKPIVYPDVPSTKQIPPDIEGKNVISIDVAYSPNIVEEISKRANKYTFLDHHKTDIEEIRNIEKNYSNLNVIYDEKESGASLTWNSFFPNLEMPTFLKYVKDNDIGEWKYKESLDFIAGLEVNYKLDPELKILKQWDNLLDNKKLLDLVNTGKKYNEYKYFLINKTRPTIKNFPSKKFVDKNHQLLNRENRYRIGLVECGCPSPSLVGKHVMENYDDLDFCIIWRYDLKSKKYFLSLRGSEKAGVDVGEIAKYFGGGGHKYASGCSLPGKYKIEDLVN